MRSAQRPRPCARRRGAAGRPAQHVHTGSAPVYWQQPASEREVSELDEQAGHPSALAGRLPLGGEWFRGQARGKGFDPHS